MPFQSESQRRFMWSQHPQIAQKWANEYPNQKNLPMHKKKNKHSASEQSMAMKIVSK